MCFFFNVKHKKITIFSPFNLTSNSLQNPRWRLRWRPLLVTSQASSSATTHKIYLILLTRTKAFHCFEILQRIKNSRGGFHPPPHLYHSVVWICVYVRGLIKIKHWDFHVGFCILPLNRLRHYLSLDVCIPYFSYNLKNEIYYFVRIQQL